MVDEVETRVSGFSLFEYNIKPEWEDEINSNGGEFKLDFKANLTTV